MRHAAKQWSAAFDSVDNHGIRSDRNRQHDGLASQFVDALKIGSTNAPNVGNLQAFRAELEDAVAKNIATAWIPNDKPFFLQRLKGPKYHILGHSEAHTKLADAGAFSSARAEARQDLEDAR